MARNWITAFMLCGSAALCGAPPALAQGGVAIPHSAFTGETYRNLDNVSRAYYLAGLVDGLLGAPLLAGNARLAETLHECLLQFHPAQTVAIVDKYIADHPADWQLDMHILALQALRAVCPSFESEFRRSFQQHP
jgi:hypothetical protein